MVLLSIRCFCRWTNSSTSPNIHRGVLSARTNWGRLPSHLPTARYATIMTLRTATTHHSTQQTHPQSPPRTSQRTVSARSHQHIRLPVTILHIHTRTSSSRATNPVSPKTSQLTGSALYHFVRTRTTRLVNQRKSRKPTSAAAPSVTEMQTVLLPHLQTQHSFVSKHHE